MRVNQVVKQQCGEGGIPYMPLAGTLICLVAFSNMFGLDNLGLTSQVGCVMIVTACLMMGVIIDGVWGQQYKIFLLFVPECSISLAWLLIVIEIFSYFIRMGSLALRLVANIMAGHTLLYLCVNFVTVLSVMGSAHIVLCGVAPIMFLEFCVAVIQAYILVVLFMQYVSETK